VSLDFSVPENGLASRMGGSLQPSPLQVGLGVTLAVLVVVYPFVFDWLIERVGVRIGSLALLGYAAFFAFARRQMGIPVRLVSLSHVGIVAIVSATFATGDVRYLLLVPALIYLMVLRRFWASLSEEITIIEKVARFIVPVSPDFIGPYCRKSTIGWCIFFVANSAIIAWLAVSGRVEAWRIYTGWMMFAIIGAICVVDFFIRKWWFRYYFQSNLFDRLWSRVFPAEATPMGRRSMQYIRAKRLEQGRPEP